MPVTHEALEASWEEVQEDAPVYHGTRIAALPGIAREGILPGERTHVHLAEALDSTVGKRSAVDVMIEVSPARLRAEGFGLFRSPNGVLLTRHVPVAAIVGLVPMIERAQRRQWELLGLFGLSAPAP
jgi:putative RNA 2'-phosphotransferase